MLSTRQRWALAWRMHREGLRARIWFIFNDALRVIDL